MSFFQLSGIGEADFTFGRVINTNNQTAMETTTIMAIVLYTGVNLQEIITDLHD